MAVGDESRSLVRLNADDFGRSASINAAVLRAHREGVLTSASLMVTGQAVAEAVALARQTPSLAVGLHLALAGAKAALPAEKIPHLVGPSADLPTNPLQAALLYLRDAAARRELAREMRAQFDLFAATGLPLAHVDGHMHLHLLPGVFDLVLVLAQEYGARALRVPRDDLGLSLAHSRRLVVAKVVWAVVFFWLGGRARRRMDRAGSRLAPADRVYGLLESGHMTETYVLRVLRSLERLDRAFRAELYFHPDSAPQVEDLGPNPGDLACLLSPAVKRAVLGLNGTLTAEEGGARC